MRLWGLKTCDTCRKAEKALRGAGHEVEVIDVRADGVDPRDLARFQAAFGAALVNTRSATWRGLGEAEREGDPLGLLTVHPTAMKRPVIEHEGELFLGWGAEVRERLLRAV